MGKKIYTIFKDGKRYDIPVGDISKQRGWHGDTEGHSRAALGRGGAAPETQPSQAGQPQDSKPGITGKQVGAALLTAAGIAAALHPASRALLGRGIARLGHKLAMGSGTKEFIRRTANIDKKGFFDGVSQIISATGFGAEAYGKSVGARIIKLGTKITPKGRKLGVGFDVAEDLISAVGR